MTFKPNSKVFDIFKKYELKDKLEKVISCCNTLRGE